MALLMVRFVHRGDACVAVGPQGRIGRANAPGGQRRSRGSPDQLPPRGNRDAGVATTSGNTSEVRNVTSAPAPHPALSPEYEGEGCYFGGSRVSRNATKSQNSG